MKAIAALLLLTSVAIGAWLAVAVVRRYALRALVDVPNARSSHAAPTPRGGGVGIVVANLTGLVTACLLGVADETLVIALAGGGLVVAVIGFLDDHKHVSPYLRLMCHVSAAVWLVYWVGRLPPIDFGSEVVDLGVFGVVLVLLSLVWFVNLFNFMDGIDGIAGAQSIFMTAAGAALAYTSGGGEQAVVPMLLLAAAVSGFLAWNWPPSRIFLGDVGSGYLGFMIGAIALWSVVEGWLTIWVWVILAGAFLADSTVTLIVRALARASLVEAHRSHAYQRLSRRWNGHASVTLAFTAVNLFWLGPWAFLAARFGSLGASFALVALSPLVVAAIGLGAGRRGEIGEKG